MQVTVTIFKGYSFMKLKWDTLLCAFMYVYIFNDGNYLEQVIEELALRMLFEKIFTF